MATYRGPKKRLNAMTPMVELKVAVAGLLEERAPQRVRFDEIATELLRRGFRFTRESLQTVLVDYRAPQRVAKPSPRPAPATPKGIAVDAAAALFRYEVEAVEVVRHSVLGSRLRIDKVADQQSPYVGTRLAAAPRDASAGLPDPSAHQTEYARSSW